VGAPGQKWQALAACALPQTGCCSCGSGRCRQIGACRPRCSAHQSLLRPRTTSVRAQNPLCAYLPQAYAGDPHIVPLQACAPCHTLPSSTASQALLTGWHAQVLAARCTHIEATAAPHPKHGLHSLTLLRSLHMLPSSASEHNICPHLMVHVLCSTRASGPHRLIRRHTQAHTGTHRHSI